MSRSLYQRLFAVLVGALTVAVMIPVAAFSVSAAPTVAIPEGYELVSESADLTLYAHPAGRIRICQHDGQTWWDSALSDRQIEEAALNKNWQRNARSLLNLTYAHDNGAGAKDFASIGSADSSVQTAMSIENGTVRFHFDFAYQAISLEMNISLQDNAVLVSVPDDSVTEGEEAQLMSLEVLPFFGAAKSGTDGYGLVPDGCGALVRFNNPDHAADAANVFSWMIYGSRTPDIDRLLTDESGDVSVPVPVFGIKQGQQAFTAIIEQGDTEASVSLYPAGTIPYYRFMSKFHYRYTYTLTGSKISLNNDTSADVRISRERITGDRSLRYVFTAGEDSDYNGMAAVYKNYLNDHQLLNHTDLSATLPLQLELFMGTTEKRMLFDKYIPMTTYKQASDMLTDLHTSGVGTIDCLLTGWYKNGKGSNVTRYKAESKLGGQKGLQALCEAAIGAGDTLTLQTDPILIRNASLSENLVRRYAARNESQLVISSADEKTFLYSTRQLLERFLKRINPLWNSKLQQTGLQLDYVGNILYGDYSRKATVLRSDSLQQYLQIFEQGKREGLLMVTGGNAYTFADADRILDIPVKTSGYSILDEAVPFLQLVLHGNVGYSSIPGNLFNNETKDFLKWVEYGCLPYYRLTGASAAEMRYTDCNTLYTSQFSQWQPRATDICRQMQSALGDTVAAQMVSHRKVVNDVYCTTYDNGIAVYVNYGAVDYPLTEDHPVAAGGYLVVRPEGGNLS